MLMTLSCVSVLLHQRRHWYRLALNLAKSKSKRKDKDLLMPTFVTTIFFLSLAQFQSFCWLLRYVVFVCSFIRSFVRLLFLYLSRSSAQPFARFDCVCCEELFSWNAMWAPSFFFVTFSSFHFSRSLFASPNRMNSVVKSFSIIR